MELKGLTFIVTEKCNFNCSYCIQEKGEKNLSFAHIEQSLDYFFSYFKGDTIRVGFYGGEPLLAFPQIEYAVQLIEQKNRGQGKNIEYMVTTNGSLLKEEHLDFFEGRRFDLTLSFDGLAQEKGRGAGSLEHMTKVVAETRERPGIFFEVHSVFSPLTVGLMSGSLRFLVEPGGPDISFSLDAVREWREDQLRTLERELDHLAAFLERYYRETGKIPIKNFAAAKTSRKVFRCSAGTGQMAVAPGGEVWGCFLFYDYFKTREKDPLYGGYYFGNLEDLISGTAVPYPEIAANYRELRQDFFQVGKQACFLCEDINDCAVCPVIAAFTSGTPGKITCGQCRLKKIERKARDKFLEKILV